MMTHDKIRKPDQDQYRHQHHAHNDDHDYYNDQNLVPTGFSQGGG
jgi:hypothetical protein